MEEDNKDVNKIIGENLLKLRKQVKLTQAELAMSFNYSDKSVSKWENGESLPSVEVLSQLAKFYGVGLDYFTVEHIESEMETAPTQEKTKKEKVQHAFPTRLIVTLLSVCAVWIIATVLFVSLKLSFNINFYTIFLWALPISCIVMVVFNSIWGRWRFLFIILTIMLWTLLLAIHIQWLAYGLWPVYLLGIPLQIAIILWGSLVAKPRKKKTKQEPTTENKEDN